MTPAQLGALRSVAYLAGFAALSALLNFLASPANLQGLLPDGAAGIVVILAGSLEHYIESRTGNAMFGAIEVAR